MFPEDPEIDAILRAIENQMRREILRMLVEGRQYALNIARELRTSQQAVAKHLELLEESDFIRSAGTVPSGRGAPRKLYEISRSFSLFIDFAPGIFDIREYDLEDIDIDDVLSEFGNMDYGEALRKIEDEMQKLELRRVKLLKLKEKIMKEMEDY
ncbi:MAG: helix-turn-helix domain-containing protein [Euryarchaeota archaeon]|nr:helix-turn-helix domain-containing protein [Euryarchaeota archaeon]